MLRADTESQAEFLLLVALFAFNLGEDLLKFHLGRRNASQECLSGLFLSKARSSGDSRVEGSHRRGKGFLTQQAGARLRVLLVTMGPYY